MYTVPVPKEQQDDLVAVLDVCSNTVIQPCKRGGHVNSPLQNTSSRSNPILKIHDPGPQVALEAWAPQDFNPVPHIDAYPGNIGCVLFQSTASKVVASTSGEPNVKLWDRNQEPRVQCCQNVPSDEAATAS
ncbi:hypothetical protein DFH08DRAFT_953676 [Mycena albidolilacea]|uniref:Uncharacterized protein n=1 Tax=Mycena albidolilacea TaxID=1033008 RepID=A0AAD7AH77_9AGAR|nr:hypothetical protein DFH08DRAFT_953676 [Mycena albidolilacea]